MLKKIIFFTIIFSVLLTVFFYPAFYFSGKINNFSKKNKFFSDTKPFFKNEYSKITESKKAIEPSVKTEKKSLSTEITGVIKTQIGNVILNLKNELLEIIGENYINFSFNIFDQSLSFSIKSPYINDTFSGSFDIETGDVLIVNSKNYGLRGNLWNKKLIFIYEMDSLTIDNIMLSKINISIFYDEIFEISGSIEKIVAGEFSYNDFTFNYLQEKGTFEASSSDGLIRIFTDSEKNVYGIVKDIDYEFFDTSLKLHIDELRFDFTDNRLTFSPENFYFEIFNSRYNFSNGEVFYSNGIFEVKDAVFSNGSDFILFNADYSENNINYSISHKGNQKLEINENFHFFQREFEIYGTNSNFYGKASFEKGVINFENNQFLISGDLKLNSEENSSGLISIFQNEKEYKFLVSSEENFSKFFIKALSSYNFSLNTDFYDTDLKAYIMLEIIRDKENIVIKSYSDIDSGYFKLKKMPEFSQDSKYAIIHNEINLKNFEFRTDDGIFNVSGLLLLKDKFEENIINLRINSGQINIIGNRFKIINGRVNLINFKFKENLFNSLNQSEKQYVLKSRDTDLFSNLWMNLTINRKFAEYDVFGKISGYISAPEVTFYSNPPLSSERLFTMVTGNRLTQIIGGESADFEDFVDIFGIDRMISRKLEHDFGLDKVDLKAEDSDLKINVEKEIGKNVIINFKHSVTEKRSIYGIIYELSRNLLLIGEGFDISNFNSNEYRLRLRWKRDF